MAEGSPALLVFAAVFLVALCVGALVQDVVATGASAFGLVLCLGGFVWLNGWGGGA